MLCGVAKKRGVVISLGNRVHTHNVYMDMKEMETCSSVLAWKIPQQRRLVGYSPWDCKGIRYD